MQPFRIATWSEVPDREPVGTVVSNVDLVIVRFDDNHSVLYGRCLHRGALMSDGSIVGDNIVCGLHGWDYVFHTGVSSYDNSERLAKFASWIDGDDLFVDLDEILQWEKEHPQPYDRTSYQGDYQDPHGDAAEPHVGLIRRLPTKGSNTSATTGRSHRWACPARTCRAGTTSSSSPRSWPAGRNSTTCPSAPRW